MKRTQSPLCEKGIFCNLYDIMLVSKGSVRLIKELLTQYQSTGRLEETAHLLSLAWGEYEKGRDEDTCRHLIDQSVENLIQRASIECMSERL